MGASESRPASAPGSDSIAHSGKAEDGSGHAASPDQTRLKGGDYSGFGTVVYEDGYSYSGEFRAGEEDGHGVETHRAQGYEYSGQYEHGTVSGHGVLSITQTGVKYYGQFEAGKEHGFGVRITAENDKLLGEFRCGKSHGLCVFESVEAVVENNKRLREKREPIEHRVVIRYDEGVFKNRAPFDLTNDDHKNVLLSAQKHGMEAVEAQRLAVKAQEHAARSGKTAQLQLTSAALPLSFDRTCRLCAGLG